MSKKVLIVANTDRHINLCYLPYIKYLKELGVIVHVATNTNILLDYIDKKIKIPICRSPFHFKNIKAIFQLRKYILKEKYDLISCSTPMGGVIARLASKSLQKKNKTKVIYTAHGFHFFKGCPFINYLIYYPVEKYLTKYTDLLITINEEDYNFALKHFKVEVEYIEGIGFNQERLLSNLDTLQKSKLRTKLGLKIDDYVIIYIAEISKRKRQKYLLNVLKELNDSSVKLLLVGENTLNLNNYIAKLKLEKQVKVLGFREDISDLLDIADLVISVSKQEGLPLNIMEAMYKQKPIIVTNCRGNRDLIKHQENGLVVSLNDKKELIDSIKYLKNDKKIAADLSKENKELSKKYTTEEILKKYKPIYKRYLK